MEQSIKITFSLRSANKATETNKMLQKAYVDNALSKTNYYSGLVLHQEGTAQNLHARY